MNLDAIEAALQQDESPTAERERSRRLDICARTVATILTASNDLGPFAALAVETWGSFARARSTLRLSKEVIDSAYAALFHEFELLEAKVHLQQLERSAPAAVAAARAQFEGSL